MNSNDDSKRSGNPKNPEVIPALPDVDTGDLVLPNSPPVSTPVEQTPDRVSPPIKPGVKESGSYRRTRFLYSVLSVVVLVLTCGLAYYFFFASE